MKIHTQVHFDINVLLFSSLLWGLEAAETAVVLFLFPKRNGNELIEWNDNKMKSMNAEWSEGMWEIIPFVVHSIILFVALIP